MLRPLAEYHSDFVVSYCLGVATVTSQNAVVVTPGLCAVPGIGTFLLDNRCDGVCLVLESSSLIRAGDFYQLSLYGN